MEIEMGKKYKRRFSGKPVRILCVDLPGKYAVVAVDEDGTGLSIHTLEGFYWASGVMNDNDLIEVCPYENFKIDDPVLVKYLDEEGERRRRKSGG